MPQAEYKPKVKIPTLVNFETELRDELDMYCDVIKCTRSEFVGHAAREALNLVKERNTQKKAAE